ncbi:MAG: helix-turn-helix domain-containing protein [Candidatus Peregrinibacteria bacterium]
MVQKFLRSLGLSEKETLVYLAGLELGTQPISIIAKKLGLQRTTLYNIVDSLAKKGLGYKAEKWGMTVFSIASPENLMAYLEREKKEYTKSIEKKQEDLQDFLPALLSLETHHCSKPKIRFYEGEKGVREAYEGTLQSSEPIRAYANVETMHEGLPNFFPEYYQRRRDSGVSIRAILPDNPTGLERAKEDKNEARMTRLVDHTKYSFSPEMNVYDNKVLFASWKEKMVVVIESEEIADLQKKMFDLLWEKLPLN